LASGDLKSFVEPVEISDRHGGYGEGMVLQEDRLNTTVRPSQPAEPAATGGRWVDDPYYLWPSETSMHGSGMHDSFASDTLYL
jgi:hypothetical protein